MEDTQRMKSGRKRKHSEAIRVSIHFYATKAQEDWLNEVKARTGKSWGDTLDELVEKEAAHVE